MNRTPPRKKRARPRGPALLHRCAVGELRVCDETEVIEVEGVTVTRGTDRAKDLQLGGGIGYWRSKRIGERVAAGRQWRGGVQVARITAAVFTDHHAHGSR
jgi:hypothetical protein